MIPEIGARAGGERLLQVGIGTSTGVAPTGAVGPISCDDYTAPGDALDIASCFQCEAAPGEPMVTEDACRSVSSEYPRAIEKVLTLKGIHETVKATVLDPPSVAAA